MLRRLHYSVVLSLPLIGAAGMLVGGWATWLLPVGLFGLVPAVEHFLPGSHDNPTPEQEQARRADWGFDVLLFAAVPLQLGMLALFFVGLMGGWWDTVGLLGAVATAGISGGALGINVAHELGHRTTRPHRLAAWVLLASVNYLHFYIEHNRGHHARVATPLDPASARRGEAVFAFWLRSVRDSWRSAWGIENRRLRKKPRPSLSPDNLMLRFTVVQVALLAAVGAVLGPIALFGWLAVSLFAILLLETVNYIEHYGLQREEVKPGRYERVQPHHSWNSEHPIGRVLLFDLSRHSDHHANPGRPYPILRHHDGAPELPTGYPGMVVLALFPPIFKAVMERQLDRETARRATLEEVAA